MGSITQPVSRSWRLNIHVPGFTVPGGRGLPFTKLTPALLKNIPEAVLPGSLRGNRRLFVQGNFEVRLDLLRFALENISSDRRVGFIPDSQPPVESHRKHGTFLKAVDECLWAANNISGGMYGCGMGVFAYLGLSEPETDPEAKLRLYFSLVSPCDSRGHARVVTEYYFFNLAELEKTK